MPILHRLASFVQKFKHCILCDLPVTGNGVVCLGCETDLPWHSSGVCYRCAMLVGYEKIGRECGECLKNPPIFDQVVAAFAYTHPVKQLIRGLKFGQGFYAVPFLTEALVKVIRERYQPGELPEVIIPVPLHVNRLRARGFNQSVEIGKGLSHHLGLPLARREIIRVHQTRAQSELGRKERKKQRFVWEQKRPIQYARVAIVDDVMTTGSTVKSLAQFIKEQNRIERVDIWVCGRVNYNV